MNEGRARHVGSEVRRLLGRLDRSGNLERARAVAAWQEVAGPEVAKHATGYAMRGSELVVFADAAVWAAELTALSEHYRAAVNERLGQEMVGSIRFTVTRSARRRGEDAAEAGGGQPSSSEEPAGRVEPLPLDPGEEERLSGMAKAIHDERLRQAALGAAKRHLEWQKGMQGPKAPQAGTGRPAGTDSGSDH